MNLPVVTVYDRSTQELEDMVNDFMQNRSIPACVMELMLYKVLSNVQKQKEYEYANMSIMDNQQDDSAQKEVK